MENPFASYTIEIPSKYSELSKKLSMTGSDRDALENAPFERQVDLWYFAFLYAVQQNFKPTQEKETTNITGAHILNNDSYRVAHIQLAYLGYYGNLEELADHRKVFNFALEMANSGYPHVLATLNDNDNQPLWNCLDKIESLLR